MNFLKEDDNEDENNSIKELYLTNGIQEAFLSAKNTKINIKFEFNDENKF